MSKRHPCLTTNCNRHCTHGAKDGSARGLCPQCYQSAKRLVNKGQATWHELESLGLAITPLYHRTPKPTTFELDLETRRAAAAPSTQEPSL